LLTPQMAERYNAYKDGKRPQVVTDASLAFFDPVSGEPIIWFAKDVGGRIELFDLVGFHPQTGEELKPVDKEIVNEWRKQSSKVVRRVPNRITDPNIFGFFDPLTGDSRIWFWVSETKEYEFFDGPGFHPTSGDALKAITREAIADWKQAIQLAAEKARKEQIRKAQEIEANNLADQKAADDLLKLQQSGLDCDRLATNPTDSQRKADGTPFDALRLQADIAFDACSKATKQFPTELRYQYQLGRAAQFKDKKKAFELFTSLTNAGYAAAFDNLGGMYQDKNDLGTATRLFQAGAKLGDADSMVSLAELIQKGYLTPPDATNVRLALLKKAGELGHAGAQRAFEVELEKAQTAQQQRLMQQQIQSQMLGIFGAVVQGAMHR
jgi:TPR repeat protein